MVRSLLYLTASRMDIIFNIYMCAYYQSNPKESHIATIKKNFKYLIKTKDVSLWYSKQSSLDLIGYSDSDFINYYLDRKSISGTCQFLDVN